MKLSEFDLSSYLKTPLVHRFSDEWSRPGLTNFLGSVQADGDPTGIRHPIFPPVSSAEEFTCYLTINGEFLPSTGVKTTVRWSPHQIVRECRWEKWEICSTLAMVPGEQAIVQHISITSKSKKDEALELGVRLSGRCINRGMVPWGWCTPFISTPVSALTLNHGLDPLITPIGKRGLLFQERKMTECKRTSAEELSHSGKAFNAQCLHPAPNSWLSNGDAYFKRTIKPGKSFVVDFALAMDTTAEAASIAEEAVRQVPAIIRKQEKLWSELWRDAFRPGNKNFDGALPDLEVTRSLAPAAASATLNLLMCRRQHRITKGRTFYNILTPRRCEVGFYTWDWGLATSSLARLDPAPVKRQLEIVWKNDFRKLMQFNFVTEVAGGWPYSADIFSLFFATDNYWKGRGETVSGLRELLATRNGKQTILQCLEELAFNYRTHLNPEFGLADFGPKGDLLECVTTYAHIVAALNAAAFAMLERVADIYDMIDRKAEAETLRAEARVLLDRLLEHLYVAGKGYFVCLQPDGRKIECRHAYDLGMVLLCVGEHLPKTVQNEMVTFFQKELQTPTWVRALSPHDRDAAVSGLRADHQFCGSYTAWAGLISLGLLKIGRREVLAKWLPGFAKTALQGPFGQGHWDERVMPPTAGGATKVSDELPQGCHWCDISGGLYFHVVEQFLKKPGTAAASQEGGRKGAKKNREKKD